jgi:hypothetical protein
MAGICNLASLADSPPIAGIADASTPHARASLSLPPARAAASQAISPPPSARRHPPAPASPLPLWLGHLTAPSPLPPPHSLSYAHHLGQHRSLPSPHHAQTRKAHPGKREQLCWGSRCQATSRSHQVCNPRATTWVSCRHPLAQCPPARRRRLRRTSSSRCPSRLVSSASRAMAPARARHAGRGSKTVSHQWAPAYRSQSRR